MTLVLPIVEVRVKTVSEMNAHEHWRARQKRAKGQRNTTMLTLLARCPRRPALPLHVTLVRFSAGALDCDNLASSQKHVRDAVAAWLGCGDSPSDPITWAYRQAPAPRGRTWVEIEFRRVA